MKKEIRNETNKKTKGTTVAHFLAKAGILSALSFVLYLLRFPIAVIFPSFLDFQISDMPALLAGFAMGPLGAVTVVIMRSLLKIITQGLSFGGIGDLADIAVGLAFTLPSAIIYHFRKTKKAALLSIGIGIVATVLTAVIMNRFVLVPFMTGNFGFDAVIGMLKSLFPDVTAENLYGYYIPLSVVPFNLLRCLVSGGLTFVLYKRLSKILKW